MRSRRPLLLVVAVLAVALAPASARAFDIGVGTWEHLCPTDGSRPPARCLGPRTLDLFGQRPVSLRVRVADAAELPAARALGTLVARRGGRAIFALQGGVRAPPDSGRRRRAYQRLVAAAHAALGTLGALEVWNEPNLAAQWGGRPRADHYGRLVCAASAAAPGGQLLFGGLAHPRPDREGPTHRRATQFLRQTIRTVRHGCPTALSTLGLSVHPYGPPPQMIATLRTVRRVLNGQRLRTMALHVTEFGWPVAGPRHRDTIGPRRQAARLDHVLTRLAGPEGRSLHVESVYYFALADGVPYRRIRGRLHDFPLLYTGLHDAGFTPRPAWNVFLDWLGRPQ